MCQLVDQSRCRSVLFLCLSSLSLAIVSSVRHLCLCMYWHRIECFLSENVCGFHWFWSLVNRLQQGCLAVCTYGFMCRRFFAYLGFNWFSFLLRSKIIALKMWLCEKVPQDFRNNCTTVARSKSATTPWLFKSKKRNNKYSFKDKLLLSIYCSGFVLDMFRRQVAPWTDP